MIHVDLKRQAIELLKRLPAFINRRARHMNTEFLHANVKCGAFDSEASSSTVWSPNHPIRLFEGAHNLSPFRLIQRFLKTSVMDRTGLRNRRIGFCADIRLEFGKANMQHRTFRNDDRPLDHILQFSNISRPVIAEQSFHSFRRDGVDHAVIAPAEFLNEVTDQQRNIFAPFARNGGTRTGKTFNR